MGKPTTGSTERAYAAIKTLAISYKLRPGERINEVNIASQLGISRTPVREALNRLVAENLIIFEPQKGFVARKLDLDEILQLYELRTALEVSAFRLSCDRASEEDIEAHRSSWTQNTGENYASMSVEEIIAADEAFHHGLAALSGNNEMVAVLDRVMAQIRFCRTIDLEVNWRHEVLYSEHLKIVDLLKTRQLDEGVQAIVDHIQVSREHALHVMKEALARIYMP